MFFQRDISINSKGLDSIYDITDHIANIVRESKISKGLVNVFHPGSTASITITEFEHGLEKDFQIILNKLIPRGSDYNHEDGNGDAHLKAALIGPQITIPFKNSEIQLGTWQQILLVDSDNKARNRKIIVTVFGD
jgi:secondary thiamine-phosphate synthase enzyme